MTEDIERRRKRLAFRSWRRGTKELDLLLGRFSAVHLPDFRSRELDEYEAILTAEDPDIMAWIAGRAPVPEDLDNGVMRKLLDFRYHEHGDLDR